MHGNQITKCIEIFAAKKCRDDQLQRFKWDNEGRIHPISDMNLRLTIAKGEPKKGGGGSPVHVILNIRLKYCSDTLQSFQRWGKRNIRAP